MAAQPSTCSVSLLPWCLQFCFADHVFSNLLSLAFSSCLGPRGIWYGERHQFGQGWAGWCLAHAQAPCSCLAVWVLLCALTSQPAQTHRNLLVTKHRGGSYCLLQNSLRCRCGLDAADCCLHRGLEHLSWKCVWERTQGASTRSHRELDKLPTLFGSQGPLHSPGSKNQTPCPLDVTIGLATKALTFTFHYELHEGPSY